jgi:hypothetical protein
MTCVDISLLNVSEDGTLILMARIPKICFFFRTKMEEKFGTLPHPPTTAAG